MALEQFLFKNFGTQAQKIYMGDQTWKARLHCSEFHALKPDFLNCNKTEIKSLLTSWSKWNQWNLLGRIKNPPKTNCIKEQQHLIRKQQLNLQNQINLETADLLFCSNYWPPLSFLCELPRSCFCLILHSTWNLSERQSILFLFPILLTPDACSLW